MSYSISTTNNGMGWMKMCTVIGSKANYSHTGSSLTCMTAVTAAITHTHTHTHTHTQCACARTHIPTSLVQFHTYASGSCPHLNAWDRMLFSKCQYKDDECMSTERKESDFFLGLSLWCLGFYVFRPENEVNLADYKRSEESANNLVVLAEVYPKDLFRCRSLRSRSSARVPTRRSNPHPIPLGVKPPHRCTYPAPLPCGGAGSEAVDRPHMRHLHQFLCSLPFCLRWTCSMRARRWATTCAPKNHRASLQSTYVK